MYRIPKYEEVLEVWGESIFPYREDAHFTAELSNIGDKEYVHARFWRKYDFTPSVDNKVVSSMYENGENEWKPFTSSPDGADLKYEDSLCFLSIASYYGGEYPYDFDALNNQLPGFYIDTPSFSNIHCFKLKDIKFSTLYME